MQRPRTVREIVALPRSHLIRGAQIPIAHRGWSTRSHSRGFLPWRLSDAGRQSLPHPPSRPASETLHKSAALTKHGAFPLFSDKQIFSQTVGTSHIKRPTSNIPDLSAVVDFAAGRMGGAKRYPSIAVREHDGFRKELDPIL